MGRRVAGLVRAPVPGEVEEDDPVAGGGQIGGQPAVHLAVEEDPVHEDEDVRPRPVDLVVDLEPLDLERPVGERPPVEQGADGGDGRQEGDVNGRGRPPGPAPPAAAILPPVAFVGGPPGGLGGRPGDDRARTGETRSGRFTAPRVGTMPSRLAGRPYLLGTHWETGPDPAPAGASDSRANGVSAWQNPRIGARPVPGGRRRETRFRWRSKAARSPGASPGSRGSAIRSSTTSSSGPWGRPTTAVPRWASAWRRRG